MNVDFDALALNESPDATIVVAPDATIVHWSKGAQRIFGYQRAEAAGRSWR